MKYPYTSPKNLHAASALQSEMYAKIPIWSTDKFYICRHIHGQIYVKRHAIKERLRVSLNVVFSLYRQLGSFTSDDPIRSVVWTPSMFAVGENTERIPALGKYNFLSACLSWSISDRECRDWRGHNVKPVARREDSE